MLNKSSCISRLSRHTEQTLRRHSVLDTESLCYNCETLNQVQGDISNKGFTLIELLVVVLIIGILASVALPQYQKAVEKSRAAQALVLLKAVVKAQESYFLANGDYARKFDELTVDIPWTGDTKWATSGIYDTLSSDDWSIQLWKGTGSAGIYTGRLTGKYKGGGFVYYFSVGSTMGNTPTQQILCAERNSNGVVFEGNSGDYCKKIFGGTFKTSVGAKLFTLP